MSNAYTLRPCVSAVPIVRRCHHKIVADVLAYLSAAGRAKLTWVAAYANLPLDRARLLLGEMEHYGLVESFEGEGGSRYYRVTGRGRKYLALWRRLQTLAGY